MSDASPGVEHQGRRSSRRGGGPGAQPISTGVSLVLVLLGLSAVIDGVVDMRSIQTNNELLETRLEQQLETFAQARRVRTQLSEIAGATARLADQGNPNAIAIRDRFEAQGIQLRAASP